MEEGMTNDNYRALLERSFYPRDIASKLKCYQKQFGEEFGLSELLQLEQIRRNAILADAIDNVLDVVVYQLRKVSDDEELPLPYRPTWKRHEELKKLIKEVFTEADAED